MTGAKKRIGGMCRPCPRLENRQLDVLDRRGKIAWYDLAPASRQLHTHIPDLLHTAPPFANNFVRSLRVEIERVVNLNKAVEPRETRGSTALLRVKVTGIAGTTKRDRQ